MVDGLEAIRRIRPMEGGKEPTIIAVAASAMDENRHESMEIGADDFISKPFREAGRFEKIHAHVGVEYVYAEPSAASREESDDLTPGSLALAIEISRNEDPCIFGGDASEDVR